jgi:hypothetical protein
MYGGCLRPPRTTSDAHHLGALPGALLGALILAVCPTSGPRAGEVFKSVDADGNVVYSDHADPTAPSSVVQLEDAYPPPRVIHFCWTNCFTLELDGGVYRRADGSDETWTVERFTSTSILLHRHDAPAAWNGFSADVAYEGQVSSGRLINVTVGGRLVPDIQAAWGGALDTLPGSNAERDSPSASSAVIHPVMDVEIRTTEAPPPLQNEVQPPCADDGDLWTPGYWAWGGGGGGYYWVPGAWVPPPRVGVFWTPGYWGFAAAVYVFHPGYWAPHVGYYGGINYGFGYVGVGFAGGRWVGNSFAYNRALNNLNSSVIHNTYDEAPIANANLSKVSYNGGPGGVAASPTAVERAVASEPHIPSTAAQRQYVPQAAAAPALVARANVGHPAASVHKSAALNVQGAVTHAPIAASAGVQAGHTKDVPAQPAAAPKVTSTAPTKPQRPTH